MSDPITPMDIEKQEFRRTMRGYDPETVRLYLKSVAEHVVHMNLRNGELREEIGRVRRELEEHRSSEKALQETLVSAQTIASELKERSREEADLVVRKARMKAEHLLHQSQDQLARIEDEIGRCGVERDAFEQRLRSTIQQHLQLLDLRQRDRDGDEAVDLGNVRVLRPRIGSEVG